MNEKSASRPFLWNSFVEGWAIFASTALLVSCDQPADPTETSAPSAEPANAVEDPVIEAPILAPLGRAEIVAAAALAAEATALGQAPPAGNAKLVDRRFEVRVPFGCGGATKGAWWNWSFDELTSRLTLSATLSRVSKSAWLDGLASPLVFDKANGLWMDHPWITSDTCPVTPKGGMQDEKTSGGAPPGSAQVLPAEPEPGAIGLVQFFDLKAPRTRQQGDRPLDYIGKWAGPAAPGQGGFLLHMSGRIRSFPGGEPVRCQQGSANERPACVVRIEIGEISFELPGSHENLATWQF
jgi:hypothetical protein